MVAFQQMQWIGMTSLGQVGRIHAYSICSSVKFPEGLWIKLSIVLWGHRMHLFFFFFSFGALWTVVNNTHTFSSEKSRITDRQINQGYQNKTFYFALQFKTTEYFSIYSTHLLLNCFNIKRLLLRISFILFYRVHTSFWFLNSAYAVSYDDIFVKNLCTFLLFLT